MATKLNTSTSIVDALKAQGQDSSYSARKKLAEANGISNYTGTAEQNKKLLSIVNSGSSSSSTSTSKTTSSNSGSSASTSPVNTQTTSGTTSDSAVIASALLSLMNNSNNKYTESSSVSDARATLEKHNSSKVDSWDGGTYSENLKNVIDKISNKEPFSYDLNGDLLYQQYRDQYINQGKLAMQDAIGTASAMTGGYGNSYASTVGNQQYQANLQELNNVVPELYQMALNSYNQDLSNLYNEAGLYNTMYNTEYGEYRDQVSDWNAEADRLTNIYNNERSFDYGQYSDQYNRAFNEYQQQVSEDQWQQQFDESKRQYNQSYALQLKNSNNNSTIAALKEQIQELNDKYEGYLSPDMQAMANHDEVNAFNASILSEYELKKRGYKASVNGQVKRFDDYSQYVDAVLEDWWSNNKLTDKETEYLKALYGL